MSGVATGGSRAPAALGLLFNESGIIGGNIYSVADVTLGMSKAVKVDEDAKSRLEELQAEIRLETGESVTQQELLSRLIDDAYQDREAVIDSFRSSTVPLSDAEKARMVEGRVSSGVEIREEDIDDILYGGPEDV